MAGQVVRGRAVRVEIATSFGSPIAVTGVSQAANAVVTAPGHGRPEFAAGYFMDCAGMIQLEGQAVQVMGPTTNSFLARGLDTRDYSALMSALFVPVLTWITFREATSYTISVEDPRPIDRTTVVDIRPRSERGLGGAQTLGFRLLAMTVQSDALLQVEQASTSRTGVLMRIIHRDGAVRIARGVPSFPGEDVQQGAVGTGALTVFVDGAVLKLPGDPVVPLGAQNYVVPDYIEGDYVSEDYA